MPSRSRSFSRGRASKRYRSVSRGSGMYSAALRSVSRPRSVGTQARMRSRVRPQGTHTFSRHCAPQELSMNGLYLSRMYEVMFNDMIQSGDFTSLFDLYRITKVTFKFQLITNPDAAYPNNGTGTSSTINPTNWFPKLWYVTDYDGGATETLNSIRERQGVKCRILRPHKEVKISFTPKCRVLTYKTADTEGFAPRNIKIDMNDTDIPHYGLACVFDTNGVDPNDSYPFKISVERKLTFQCYGVR